MRPVLSAAFCALISLPAHADVDAALDAHVLPGMDRLTDATAALAIAPCGTEAQRDAFAGAARAWAGVSHLTFGPAEENGRARAIEFWPDTRDATGRGLRLLIEQGPDAWTSEAIARASVAARGLGALERLIYEQEGEPCALTSALASDLAATAAAIRDDWRDGFAETMRSAGQDGNTRFLDESEAAAALFTALLTGLEQTADARLGAPLGTFDQPRANRAELRRAGLSLAMITESLTAARELAAALAPAPQTDAALARAVGEAERLADPALAGVAEPMSRVRIEALQTSIRSAIDIAAAELGPALGVQAGFNSADGD